MSTLLIDSPIVTKDGGDASIVDSPATGMYWVAYLDTGTQEWDATRINQEGYLVDENYELVLGQTEPFVVNDSLVADTFLAVYPDESLASFTEVNSDTQMKVTYAYLKYPDGSVAVTSATVEILP